MITAKKYVKSADRKLLLFLLHDSVETLGFGPEIMTTYVTCVHDSSENTPELVKFMGKWI